MRLKVFLVAGARPNFMKVAPIYHEMKRHADRFEPMLVHTGQHYDENMSKVFFEDLELPEPDLYLGVGSGTHAEQTADIMKTFEPTVGEHQPDLVIVVGDVNSTVACALTVAKTRISSETLPQFWQRYESFIRDRSDRMGGKATGLQNYPHDVPLLAHVEAGERSFDWSMPEEINRVTTDVLSQLLFTTSEDADQNLISEGVEVGKIFRVGNIMIDSLEKLSGKAARSKILDTLNVNLAGRVEPMKPGNYGLVTLHRAGNVDDAANMATLLSALIQVSDRLPLIFPAHPRTRKLIERLDQQLQRRLSESKVILTEPMSYLDFLHLQNQARLVLTDSGGVQVETTYLGVPCLTLRPNTEWKITLRQGTNRLIEVDQSAICEPVLMALERNESTRSQIPLWDGRSACRIVELLAEVFMLGEEDL